MVRVVSDKIIRVIHKRKQQDAVVEEDIQIQPEKIIRLVYACLYSREEIISRARNLKGQCYNLLFANCEHFAYEARTGTPISLQVNTGLIALIVGSIIGGIVLMAHSMCEAVRERTGNSVASFINKIFVGSGYVASSLYISSVLYPS